MKTKMTETVEKKNRRRKRMLEFGTHIDMLTEEIALMR